MISLIAWLDALSAEQRQKREIIRLIVYSESRAEFATRQDPRSENSRDRQLGRPLQWKVSWRSWKGSNEACADE